MNEKPDVRVGVNQRDVDMLYDIMEDFEEVVEARGTDGNSSRYCAFDLARSLEAVCEGAAIRLYGTTNES